MKFNFIKTLLAAAFVLAAGPAFADSGSKTTPCYFTGKTLNIDSGCTLTVKSGGTLNLNAGATESNQATKTSGGSTDVSGVAFSTALTGNPLTQMNGINVPVASINQGYTFLVSQSGKSIIPHDFTLMASGTATTATAVGLYCTSGNTIATFPIAMLVTGKPVGPFSSAGNSVPTLASSFTRGCIAGDSVYVSNTGAALAGTTSLFINWIGTVQSNPIQ